MVPKDLNALLTFVHAAETANSRFGTNLSPEKVWHFLVAPNYKNSAKIINFLVSQRNLRCFYAGAVAPK